MEALNSVYILYVCKMEIMNVNSEAIETHPVMQQRRVFTTAPLEYKGESEFCF